MRNVENIADSAWRVEGAAGAVRRGRGLRAVAGGGSSRSVHSSSGRAAPARSGETGLMGIRRNALGGRRQAAFSGAAQQQRYSPVPIWLAALAATECLATRNGEDHAVRWDCVSGRAVYTNSGADTETIHPLGVSLEGGQSLAVYWMPGETAYTVEVYGQN